MLVVSHELAFVRDVADRVVFMQGGRVIEAGPPGRVLTSPTSAELAAFIARFTRGETPARTVAGDAP